MTTEVKMLVNKCIENPFNLRVFINNDNEIIFSTKVNIYFRLADVETELDFKSKVLEWLSYHTADNHGCFYPKISKKIEDMINYILNTRFSHQDLQRIYGSLGNRINHDLTVKFINSNYDMSLLEA